MSAFRSFIKATVSSLAVLAASGLAGGCAVEDGSDEYDFTSDQATLLEFDFQGELVANSVWDGKRAIEDQLLYTIGHLNGENSVGRLDKLTLTDIQKTAQADGTTKVTYRAKMPVAWGKKTNLPKTYRLRLPKNVDYDDYQKFVESYGHSCVDWGAHDVDAGSMWYYYRPNKSGCKLKAEDVVETTATVTVSPENTTGKYPEYHKIWEDEALRVVAIFGKYEDGAKANDAGISGYATFVKELARRLKDYQPTTVPATLPAELGVDTPDITVSATLPDGKKLEIVSLLVDNVSTAGAEFNARYEALSTDSDMIFYNGHAGLGQNVRALAKKGKFKAGQYQIFFMNGCDTFAYVDGYLAQARATLNPDDPSGTRYMDMVTNAMPSFFSSMPHATFAMLDGLLSFAEPKTYEQIFKNIDKSEVVLVTGEEDNVFTPGYDPSGGGTDGGNGGGYEGFEAKGSVAPGEARQHALGTLPAGTYVIATNEDPASPGGDVDLYVSLGKEPTLDAYDYRPYIEGSAESVTVTLAAPTEVFAMVYGYEGAAVASSAYVLSANAAE